MPKKQDNAKTKRWYKKHSGQKIASTAERYRLRREMVDDIKLSRGCIDCGYNKRACALQFDHVAGKTFQISSQLTCNLDRLLAEIAKCDVVCACCHAVRTQDRRGK